MQRAYIIIDPQHEYARELIRIAYERHGLKPICVYIDTRAELYKREHFPELRTDIALEHYYLDQMSPSAMAVAIKQKFDVVGIMPYFEQSLTPSRELTEALGLDWNSSEVIRRFRDKSGLKDFLRVNHPTIALGASRRVSSVAEVFSQPLPKKFVIKPNDGFANRDVGFFDQGDSKEAIAAYFGPNSNEAYVLEELLVGTEFAVNGQMDAQGNATVVSVLEYDRVPANNKPNVYHRTIHVPRTDAAYEAVASYAKAVMDASGLKRAPFHLELMHTADGPRLIEVGARFGGTRYVFATNAVHDNVFNHFEMAVHYYLFTTPYKGAGPNWSFYDRISYVHLDGIAERTERVYTLSGIEAIEAMPEFDGWVVKPEVGGQIRRTVDLYTVPYSAHLKSFKGRADVVAATERLKATLKINAHVTRAIKAKVDLQAAVRKLRLRGTWLLRRLAT